MKQFISFSAMSRKSLASLLGAFLFLFWGMGSSYAQVQSQQIKQGEVPTGLDAKEWASIQKQMEMSKYKAYPQENGGYASANLAHGLQIAYSQEGSTTLSPRNTEQANYQIAMRLEGIGYETLSTLGTPKTLKQEDLGAGKGSKVSYQWNENLSEWWINEEKGLEQWFTIQHAPQGRKSNTPLRLHIALQTDMQVSQQGKQLRLQKGNTTLHYDKLKVWDAKGKELQAEMQYAQGYLDLYIADAEATYPLLIDPTWTQQAYLKASNTRASDLFGWSVAISGETIVVGAYGEDSNATGVNGNQSDNSASGAGAAYVFVRSGTTWTQQAYLKASNTGAGDQFGYSVAISDETIVVGAYGEDSNAIGVNGNQADNSAINAGAAYVFLRSGTTWSQQAYLKASNTQAGDYFGRSVAISGETVVVGSDLESSSAIGVNGNQGDNSASFAGAAYVFVRSGTTWTQQAYLKASNTDANDNFGWSVAISSETIVVGAYGEDSNATGVNSNQADNSAGSSGAAYVFVRSGTTWTQQAYLKASNTDANDNFGWSVAISGETIVVGSNKEASNTTGVNGNQADNSASSAGAAYVFVRSGSTWSQQAYLKASNTGNIDEFGSSVAISGETIIVGARNESSSAIGVNGNQADNSAVNAGAAYVFVRSGTTWTQQSYLKASNTGVSDYFGRSVAISSETIVVGAYGEDSNATGIDGDQTDNSVTDAGAAYVFYLPQPIMGVKQNTTYIANSTGTYNFGNVNVGNNSGDITFTVENTVAGSNLNLTSFQITGTDAAMFTTTNFVATTINGVGTTTFTLRFTPSSAGTKTAFITIVNNSSVNNPYTFTVNGTAIEPFISVKQNTVYIPANTGTHNFGNVNVGNNSGDITFTVENTGTADLDLTSFQIAGSDAADFLTTTFVTTTVNAAGSTTFTLRFTPSSAGTKTAFITIGNNSSVHPYTFTLIGNVDKPTGNTGLYFDGVDDYVNVGNLTSNFAGNFTIQAWIKPRLYAHNIVFSAWQDGSGGARLQYGVTSSGELFAKVNSGEWHASPAGVIELNKWTHITMTFDGTNVRHYINGSLIATVLKAGTAFSGATVPYRISGCMDSGGNPTGVFNGQIDEVKVFNAVRNASEIVADMSDTGVSATGLVGYWNFDQATGQSAYDITLSGNHGTLGTGAGIDDADPLWAFRVTSNVDDGTFTQGHLRWAINQANTVNTGQTSYIDFSIQQTDATIAGKSIIALASSLPTITQSVIIDGYSAYGSAVNTAVGTTNNAQIRIEIDGQAIAPSGNALFLNSSNSTIKGLSMYSVPSAFSAIEISQVANKVEGCYIGIDANQTAKTNNNGIIMNSLANNNTIGGSSPSQANIIANNTNAAIVVDASTGNKISRNSIYDNTNGINLINGGNANKAVPVISTLTTTLATGTCENNDVIELFEDEPQYLATDQGRKYLGTATTSGTSWSFTTVGFTPNVRITATATSSTNNTSPFSVAAVVNQLPFVTTFTKTGTEDTPLVFAQTDFGTNYSDPENMPFTSVRFESLPLNGVLAFDNAGVFTSVMVSFATVNSALNNLHFYPNTDWNGMTSFDWLASDGANYSVFASAVFITINPVNDLPLVRDFDKGNVAQNAILTLANLDFQNNFSDYKDIAPFTSAWGHEFNSISFVSVPNASVGVLEYFDGVVWINIASGQSFTSAELSGGLRFNPNGSNYAGFVTVQWQGADLENLLSSNQANLTFTYMANQPPFVTTFSKGAIVEDGVLSFTLADFASRYSDPETVPLFRVMVQTLPLPTDGTLFLTGSPIVVNQEISAAQLSNLTFVPTTDWNGTTSFGWRASDGANYSVFASAVFITVYPVNDQPLVRDFDKGNVVQNAILTLANLDFQNNFSDYKDIAPFTSAWGHEFNSISFVSVPNASVGVLEYFNGGVWINIASGQSFTSAELAGGIRFNPNSSNYAGFVTVQWQGADLENLLSSNQANLTFTYDNVIPLHISSLDPPRNALNVANDYTITTEFSTDVDTPDNTKIKVIGSQTGSFAGFFDMSNPLTFTPDLNFKAGETVTVAFLTTLQGTGGEVFSSAHQYQFTAAAGFAYANFITSSPMSTGAGTNPQSVCAFDLENDGDLDLAVANYGNDNISIFVNNGNGTYQPKADYNSGGVPASIVTFDADNDGFMDIATANFSAMDNTVSILINLQNGTFANKLDYSAGTNPNGLAAYDADGDGDMDLAVSNWGSDKVTILKNDGLGAYFFFEDRSIGDQPNSIASFDADSDGDMDLVVANYNSNTISVLFNNGIGAYPIKNDYSTGANPKSVYIFDSGEDTNGDLDIAVASWMGTNVEIFTNNGTGLFALGSTHNPSLGSISQVVALDMEGDGDLDLAMAGAGANIPILQNNGSGSYALFSQTTTPNSNSALCAFDADGDADMDLAVVSGSGNVTILFNSATPIIVGNTNDSGAGSLAQAILDANSNPDPNVIEFNLPNTDPFFIANGYWQISPNGTLNITQALSINGYSQAGATPNTNDFGDEWNGVLKVQISGAALTGNIFEVNADNVHIKGLNLVSASNAAIRFGGANSSVEGCLIGTNIDGTAIEQNTYAVMSQGQDNTIGGANNEARNILSGNQEAVTISTVKNKVIGNYVGTDKTGQNAIPNYIGIQVMNVGQAEITQNLVSGNSGYGIYLIGAGNILSLNLVGTDATGYFPLSNEQYGIWVDANSSGNTIGSYATGGNTISANLLSQIFLEGSDNTVQANYIGTNIDGEYLGFAAATTPHGVWNTGWGNIIGGTSTDDGNVISGNLGNGIETSTGLTIQNNWIGISSNYAQLGNNLNGISLQGGWGASTVLQNTIAFNYEAGVFISSFTSEPDPVTVSQNSIYNNYGIGIDLLGDPSEQGISPNDPQDLDSGKANLLMNYPEFPAGTLADFDANDDLFVGLSVPASNSVVTYPLTIEFFVSDGARQGKTYVGSANYDFSDAEQMVTVTFTPTTTINLGSKLVATATDADGNTSEFSDEISVGFDCGLRPYITDVTFETNARCNLDEHEVTFELSYNSPTGYYHVDWNGDGFYDAYDVETDDYGNLTVMIPDLEEIYYPVVNSVDYPDCDSEPFEIYHFLDSEDLNPLEIDYVDLTPPSNCESSDGIVTITLAGEAPIYTTYYDVDLDGDGTFEFLTVPDNLYNEIIVEGVKGGTKVGNITIQNSWYLNCEVSFTKNEMMPFVTVTRTDLALTLEKNSLDFEESTKLTIENSEKGISYALIFSTGASRLASDFVTSTGGTLTLSTSKLIESNGLGVLAKNKQGCEVTFDAFTSISVANGIFTNQLDILRLIFSKTGGEEWKQKWTFRKPYLLQGVKYEKGDITEIDLSYNNLIDELPWAAILQTLKKLKSLNVEGNNLTFKSLQGLANAPFTFKYSKQAKINKELTFTTVETANVTLKVEVEGTGLEYQWYRNNQILLGATTATLVLKDVTPSQSGTYYATVRSKDLPELILTRNDIKLTVSPQIKPTDLAALRAFYESLNGDNWVNKWNFDDPNLANWFGIVLQNGKIVSLSLTNNNLVGELNPLAFQTSGFFTEMENLNLSGNSIRGKLPEGLKNLEKIKRLDFSDTQFENDIWEIVLEMPNVEALIFLNAQIKYIPEKISNLTKLKVFVLDKNLITTIPLGLGKLENLQILHLAKNQIETLPDIFAGLKNLERLYFHENKIKSLPKNLGLKGLKELTLSSNLISEMPDDLLSNPNLQWLEISNNLLDFNDLEKILAKQGGRTENDLRLFYTPQANFGLPQEVTIEQGASFSIKSQTSGRGNTYTWLRNNITVRRLTQPTNGDYEIINASKADAGTYTVMVTNPIAPDLTLYSQNTKVTVACATRNEAKIELVGSAKFCAEDKASKTLTANNLTAGSTVQWFRDGLRIFGANMARLTTNEVGVYRAFVTDSEGCSNFANNEIRLERLPTASAEIITDSVDPALLKIRNPENYTTFQWFRDYEPIQGAISSTWKAVQLGLYQVRIMDRNGCLGLSNQFTITPTSTEQDFESQELRIYPNPANDILQIEMPKKYAQNYQISLWNAQGQEVRQATNRNSLDVSTLPSGLYLVKVSLEGKEIWKKVQVVR